MSLGRSLKGSACYCRLAAAVGALVLVSGCTVNGTRSLPAGGPPSKGRAVLVYGVGVEGRWDYEGFAIQLAEYSLAEGNITGNCFRFNRTEAAVPSVPGPVRYFALEVNPGLFVYSPFNGSPLAGASVAFAAPAGKTVYIGDFVYGKDKVVDLRRTHGSASAVLLKALPQLQPDISLAEVQQVASPRPFLCTP